LDCLEVQLIVVHIVSDRGDAQFAEQQLERRARLAGEIRSASHREQSFLEEMDRKRNWDLIGIGTGAEP
jgi:hypothetical protein